MSTSAHRKFVAAFLLVAALIPALPMRGETTSTETPTKLKPSDVAVASEKEKTKDEEVVKLDKIEVTGSRIRTLVGEQTALPVFTLTQIELEQRGVSRLADVRWAIPQLGAANGFNDNLQNGGPSRAQQVSTSLNLRGLGGNSTLVLIDGRRVPHSGQSAPGGAGGREDFNIDGIPLSAVDRIDVLPQGAGAIYGSEAIAGVVNIVLKKNYRGVEVQLAYDNTFDTDVAQTTATITGGYAAGKLSTFYTISQTDQNGLASRDRFFTARGSYLEYNPYVGAGTLATDYIADFSATNLPGLAKPFVAIPAGSNGVFTAAQANAAAVGSHFNYADYSNEIDTSRSRSVVFKADYDLSAAVKPYLQVRWSEFKNSYTGAPITLTQYLPAAYPGNPFSEPVYLSKVFYDLPRPTTDSAQNNYGLSFGVSGQLPRDWHYDAGVSWSRNVVKDDAHNGGFDYDLLAAAMGTANPVNLSYDSSTVSDPSGKLAGLLASARHNDRTDVTQFIATADGTVWTGWAGDVKLALGGETQKEKVNFSRTPVISYLLSEPFSRRTDAAFAEISVPLLSAKQQIPFVHQLTVGSAIRYEKLSDIGSHRTPSVNVLLQPFKWLSLRASRTEGFKAPKLYDLLAPNFSTTTTITASRGIRDTLRNNEPVVGTFALTTGGQPHLLPETSVSRGFGAVVDLPYVKGLSFSVDYWDLDYTQQVGGPGYQVLIDYFPTRVIRAASSGGVPGVITGFDTSQINLAGVKTKGMDYRLTYQRTFGFGNLALSAALSDPDVQYTQATPASKPDDTYGHQPKRLTGSLFWSRAAWSVGLSANYQGQTLIYGPNYPEYARRSYLEWNPQVTYTFASAQGTPVSFWSRVLAGSKLGVTVINALNSRPKDSDLANATYAMDPRLRRYVLTVTKKF